MHSPEDYEVALDSLAEADPHAHSFVRTILKDHEKLRSEKREPQPRPNGSFDVPIFHMERHPWPNDRFDIAVFAALILGAIGFSILVYFRS